LASEGADRPFIGIESQTSVVEPQPLTVTRCAQRIEHRLFQRRGAYMQIEVDASSDVCTQANGSGARLAFGECGELPAANRAAHGLLGLPAGPLRLDFERLFVERFGPWVSALRRSTQGVPLRLHDGVRLRAAAFGGTSSEMRAWSAGWTARCARYAPGCGAGHRRNRHRTGGDGARTACRRRACSGRFHRAELRCGSRRTARWGAVRSRRGGAFTGARRSGAAGQIEAAHGGILFLDEIGDMPLQLQAALLRVLDGKEVVRLGCHRPRTVDVNVLCATHRDLPEMVRQGLFREDLMYRLCGHVLHLPALREREDFDAVLDALLLRFGGTAEQVDANLRAQLRALPWRGNVRQLAHAVQRALALVEPGATLCGEDFASSGPPLNSHLPHPAGLLKKVTEETIEGALRPAQGSATLAARQLGLEGQLSIAG
jgi:predicted ATP-dependent protease